MLNVVLLVVAFITAVPYVAECDTIDLDAHGAGIWANGAKLPFADDEFTAIRSPNGVFSVSGSIKGLSLISNGKSSPLNIIVNPPLMEVLWAPDSQKFGINVSDGGLVGTWEAYIYSIDDHGDPVPLDIPRLIMSISDEILQCEPKEEPNIGIVAWLNDSKEALLILEVPPHSSCRNMGAITGFRIAVETKKIIERISEVELRRNWGKALGSRFITNH